MCLNDKNVVGHSITDQIMRQIRPRQTRVIEHYYYYYCLFSSSTTSTQYAPIAPLSILRLIEHLWDLALSHSRREGNGRRQLAEKREKRLSLKCQLSYFWLVGPAFYDFHFKNSGPLFLPLRTIITIRASLPSRPADQRGGIRREHST